MHFQEHVPGMVQAWVGHFVSSIILPKVILSYLSTYDERWQPDKTAQKAQTPAQKARQHDNNITIVEPFAPPAVWIWWIHAAGGAGGLPHDFSVAAIKVI
jgi:hypothetical protein